MSDLVRSPRMAGEIVRKARKARGWTQAELSAHMGVRQATVSKLESGVSTTSMSVFFDALTALELDLLVSDRSDQSDVSELF